MWTASTQGPQLQRAHCKRHVPVCASCITACYCQCKDMTLSILNPLHVHQSIVPRLHMTGTAASLAHEDQFLPEHVQRQLQLHQVDTRCTVFVDKQCTRKETLQLCASRIVDRAQCPAVHHAVVTIKCQMQDTTRLHFFVPPPSPPPPPPPPPCSCTSVWTACYAIKRSATAVPDVSSELIRSFEPHPDLLHSVQHDRDLLPRRAR